ncbi:MAG: TolC family protein [Bacteroidetes bacterium]|nr:TolC family protein [Bacteroidota bacterium]
MKRTAILISMLFILVAVKAQETWTLEKCIEHALSNNIQVKQQQLQIEGSKAELEQSKLTLLPSLNGFASHGYNYGKTVDRFTNDFATARVRSNNFYLSSSLTLFDGFQKVNQMRMNQANLQATRYDTDKFMDDISLNIATAYLQILFYREALKTAQNQLQATELQVARLKKMVDAGALAQGDLYNLEAQRASESTAVVDAQNNLDLAYLTLTQMLDLPNSNGFEIEVPDLQLGEQPTLIADPAHIYDYALETQPSIKSAEFRMHSSEYGLMLAKGSQSPTLTFQASVGTGYSGAAQIYNYSIGNPVMIGYTRNAFGMLADSVFAPSVNTTSSTKPFKDQINDNINKSLAFNLNVPIFNGWSTRTSISKAKINLENSKYNLDLSKLQLRKTIEQSYADAKAALNKFQSSKSAVDAAKESFRYAEQKFNVGLSNSVDYNNAKKEFEKAESGLLQSRYEFIFKTTVLDFYMGKPISLQRK